MGLKMADNRASSSRMRVDVNTRISDCLRKRNQEPVVVTRKGKPVAVLLAVSDEDELERLVLAHSPKFQAMLDKSRRQIEEGKGIPHDEFWRQVAQRRKSAAKGKRVPRRIGTQ